MSLLDLLFPKRCVGCRAFGSYICANCFATISFETQSMCLVCGGQSFDGRTHPGCKTPTSITGSFASLVYQGIIRKLTYSFKYKPYLTDLDQALGALLYEGLIQKEAFHQALTAHSLFVPIPLHHKRLKERGYNHAHLLANQLSKKLHVPVADVLLRTRQTASQYKLTKLERQENLRGAFAIKQAKTATIPGATLFLVDDILTSGATLTEAAKILKKAGAKEVWGITLAHGT